MNVREIGAVGDGRHKDTAAIQEAVDTCAAAGGGRVVVPAGRYLTGTVFLRSNVDLHLDAGATLVGSPDREDYNADDVFAENNRFASERVTGAHLVIGYKVENVALTGCGTVDGNSGAFFGPLPDGPSGTYFRKNGNFPIPGWRPGQMIFLSQCRNVVVRDLSLVDSPYWTLFLHGCQDCRIRGLRIENPPETANGDGIDIDSCQRVTVSDCLIRSGDDSITIRGYDQVFGGGVPCADIAVSNCVLSSPCNAIRVGVGNGRIRRVRFSNLVICESRIGINVVCRYPSTQPPGTDIADVHFAGVTMDCLVPVHMMVGTGAGAPAGIRDCTFTNFEVRCQAGGYVGGNAELPLERLTFRDWRVEAHGGTDDQSFAAAVPEPFPPYGATGANGQPALPTVLYGRHIRDLAIDNFRVRWGKPLGAAWREAVAVDDVADLSLRRVDVSARP